MTSMGISLPSSWLWPWYLFLEFRVRIKPHGHHWPPVLCFTILEYGLSFKVPLNSQVIGGELANIFLVCAAGRGNPKWTKDHFWVLNKIVFTKTVCVCIMFTCGWAWHSMHVGIKEQLWGASSFLPLCCGVWGSGMGHRGPGKHIICRAFSAALFPVCGQVPEHPVCEASISLVRT